jgi:hypothetical protein
MSDEGVEPAVRRVGAAAADEESVRDAANLPPVEALVGPERRLHPRVRVIWAVGAVVAATVFGAVAAAAGFIVLDDPVRPGGGVFAFFLLFGLVLVVLRYRVWRYEVREDSLFLERGVFTRVRTVVPYVRIQHVDVSRGPLERLLGLGSVVVYTAGSRGADVTVPGVALDRADDLQTRLKQLAIAAEGEDAV